MNDFAGVTPLRIQLRRPSIGTWVFSGLMAEGGGRWVCHHVDREQVAKELAWVAKP